MRAINFAIWRVVGLAGLVLVIAGTVCAAAEPPIELQPWLSNDQNWHRDTDGPIVELGAEGAFDDTHIFAPAVAFEKHEYRLWYCGSTGTVAERVFHLGMATGRDGRRFRKHGDNPVFQFDDGRHSILTPALLRNPDGSTLREDGKLRMWFSSTWFANAKNDGGLHTLHEATSADGVNWSKPSPALLEHVYAPTVLKTGETYQMWFTDVSGGPWKFRHATSADGKSWDVTEEPVLVVDQDWEKDRLFYPHVIQIDGVYLMWYGSYWTARRNTTALGFAASTDGKTWFKHPHNPVLRPDPERPWESNYVTSHSVLRLEDGTLRIWYASRKAPPFVNKYFAINTAVWKRSGD